MSAHDTGSDRLVSPYTAYLERRIADLERRITELERMHGAHPGKRRQVEDEGVFVKAQAV